MEENKFITTIPNSIQIELTAQQLNQTGNIVYEYNPLKVLRVNDDIISQDGETILFPKNSLVDLDTDKLEFDLEHPVDILTQQSYDGSVNLILNDGKHDPKLINTRFSTTGMNTYQIVDREGDNDSNIYDESTFDSEVSLYKMPNSIAKLDFLGLGSYGNLKVGNYIFYFKLADADGNETDIVAESSIVSCHIGGIKDPQSMRGGIEDENSFKSVSFVLRNIDPAYDHVTVHYTRSSSSRDSEAIDSAYKVYEKFPIYNQISKITITGFERTIEINKSELNTQYNLVNSAKTQVSCQNMLFLGNVNNEDILYKELSDLSLHFTPNLVTESIGYVDENYKDDTGNYEYYNAFNIYNKLGYWDDEIYRFGIVYILKNYSLSPVFNVRGINELTTDSNWNSYKVFKDGTEDREYFNVDKSNYRISADENSKGVCKIVLKQPQITSEDTKAIGLKFSLHKDAYNLLKNYTRGFFFVRQKRIKTTFCQALTIGSDKSSNCPVLPFSSTTYLAEGFLNKDRILVHDFEQRILEIAESNVLNGGSAICPEYELNQPYYNQFFTASEFILKKFNSQPDTSLLTRTARHFYPTYPTISKDTEVNTENTEVNTENTEVNTEQEYRVNVTGISDDIKALRGKNNYFSSRAGASEEADKFEFAGYKDKFNSNAVNLVRGSFGPYIGLEGLTKLGLSLVNIKIPGYSSILLDDYFDIRYRDNSSFYPISSRYSWEELTKEQDYFKSDNIFRGDCYICNFTHRMIRNFQDPETPINDEIVDPYTWKDKYKVGTSEAKVERSEINRSDVNAVQIGHWVTFKCCSNFNLSLRNTNPYYPTEEGLTGRVRSFYPLQSMDVSGENKLPESDVYNKGLSKSLGDKYYFESPDVPAIKNKFHTRILYSDVAINDAYKNGFRTFRGLNYRDYPLTYGSLTKMVEWYGNIICIFEHGIAVIPVNERALASQATGGNVYINTSNVLPENPNVISDMIGSQWAESVVQTPYGIYGIDTVTKKIWKIHIEKKQFTVTVLSDFKVQSFLNSGISLSEKELTPIIGVRNVKTHYNAYKNDIMFTFYDDINTLEETAWNLCYNEILGKFVTFYSWIPSYSANIDNIFFSFNRNDSKNIARLYNGYNLITLKAELNPGKVGFFIDNFKVEVEENYTKLGTLKYEIPKSISSYVGDSAVYSEVVYEMADDTYDALFKIEGDVLSVLSSYYDANKDKPTVWIVPVKAKLSYKSLSNNNIGGTTIVSTIEDKLILASSKYLENEIDTSFWKHGQSGLMQTKEPIKPCKWYGEQHPFEFEFIVSEQAFTQKIFTDLQILSNKAAPESLHFEISGDSYSFADDKENMFFRQEAIKHLYQYYGGDICYDKDYLNITPKQRDIPYSTHKDKSTMFPIYYSRVDTINEVEDYYQKKQEVGKDYQKLSGSEIIKDKISGNFKIATHIKGCPFGEYYEQPISYQRYSSLKALGYKNITQHPSDVSIEVDIDNYHALLDAGNFVHIYALVTTEGEGESFKYIYQKDLRELHSVVYIDESLHETIMYIETLDDGREVSYRNVTFFNDGVSYYEIKQYGRLNGNMHYKEDVWNVQIPSIVYWQRNENWPNALPPLNIANNPLPETMEPFSLFKLPKDLETLGYKINGEYFDSSIWHNTRKETRIRDKYIKIRIRYTGNDLTIINGIITMFTVSYG